MREKRSRVLSARSWRSKTIATARTKYQPVMDRGYVDFERSCAMHQAAAFFVTRAKAGMDARRVYSTPTDRASGVICDLRIKLNGFYSAKNYPEHLRRVRSKDSESGKTLVFLTNNTTLPALTIAAL